MRREMEYVRFSRNNFGTNNKLNDTRMKSINKININVIAGGGCCRHIHAPAKKDSSSDATPVINYVRITILNLLTLLLVGAGQGQLIAIVGDNLQQC
jgi:hypothetical protein